MQDYENLMTEIIGKQMDLLGPEIAIKKALKVEGLKVDEKGKVVSISGEPNEVLRKLVDEYIALSGQIVKNILNPVFEKYPQIKLEIK